MSTHLFSSDSLPPVSITQHACSPKLITVLAPPCSVRLYIPNSSLTISCLWRILSRWAIHTCKRPHRIHPFLSEFGKNIMCRQQHANPQTFYLPSCSQILFHLKNYKIVTNTANEWARLPDKWGIKVFWRPLVESSRYSAFTFSAWEFSSYMILISLISKVNLLSWPIMASSYLYLQGSSQFHWHTL